MDSSEVEYKPSVRDLSKYRVYFKYFFHYVANLDFKSIRVSVSYLFFNKLAKKDYKAKSKMGVFLIRKESTDFQFINFAYEGAIKRYMLNNVDNFDVFIDAGACIGEYCIWLAGMGKRCFAFEPVNAEAIVNNISLNAAVAKNIKVYNIGLSNKKESAYFNIPKGILSSSHIVNDNKDHEDNAQLDRLDNIYQTFSLRPTDRILMKLDVEGMEPEVIQGAVEFIKTSKNITIIYEHFQSDNGRNDKAIGELGNFTFSSLDDVNRIAIKQAS